MISSVRMASSLVQCEVVASELNEPISIQVDEERQVLYALTNYSLTRVDLTKSSENVQVVGQHKREATIDDTESEDCYSQGESDEEIPRVSDPFEDSEPSTGDDEEQITDRRNWRRYAWRTYPLDNPCSILYLPGENRLVVLNEGVITFMTIDLTEGRPFAQGTSKNVFCHDFKVFDQRGIQPWSIAPTSTAGLFVFSLLDNAQLYALNTSNETPVIQRLLTTPVIGCPNLLFHPQSNTLFVYDSTQIVAVSLLDHTTVNLDFPPVGAMATDPLGFVYVFSASNLLKCTWTSKLEVVERFDNLEVPTTCTSLVVAESGSTFYLADVDTGSIHRCKKAPK